MPLFKRQYYFHNLNEAFEIDSPSFWICGQGRVSVNSFSNYCQFLSTKKMPLHTSTPFFKSNNKIHIQSGETINDFLLNCEAEFHGVQRGATVSVF